MKKSFSLVSFVVFASVFTSAAAASTAGSYHISQLINGNNWKEEYVEPFVVSYSTKTFEFNKFDNKVTLRVDQKDIPFGDIEMLRLNACGYTLIPEYAKEVNSGRSV